MSDPDEPLRQQIDEAMEKIRHQLQVLREGPTIGGPSDDRSVIAALEAEYLALKDARAGLGPHDLAPDESGDEIEAYNNGL
jgi:hypothetical protein